MKRSTTVTVIAIALLLGSGASGLLFAMPALDEQGKLKRQRDQLTSERDGLSKQVSELESQLKGMAMDTIAYFDLRQSPNIPREMESKTVESLASLTEIFNDNHIRVQLLEPKGESTGMQKPVASPSPSPGASPAPSPDVATSSRSASAAGGGAAAAAGGSPAPDASPPVSLVHKQFAFTVRGEYADLVKALTEIQGLPKAISINQYDLKLLAKSGDKSPLKPGEALQASPTSLELGFQLSITFLTGGGPAPAAAPVGAIERPAAAGDWLAFWTGLPAEAAEQPEGAATPAVAPSPALKPASPSATKHQLRGVAFEQGALRIHTSVGTPRYSALGISRQRLVVTLENTGLADQEQVFVINQGGIKQVAAMRDARVPGQLKLVIDTDGTAMQTVALDGAKRLYLASKPWNAAPQPAAQAPAPAAKRAQAAPTKPAAPAKPVALAKPAVPAAKPAVPVAAKPAATPTPAKQAKQAAKPVATPTPAPIATPTPMATPRQAEGPRLSRSLSSTYRFPIEREHTTGRVNPFKVLPNRNATPAPGALGAPVAPPPAPVPAQGLPKLPGLPGAPGMPAAAAPAYSYQLKGVMIWGSTPPVAVIQVAGRTRQVGLNDSLPGNAKVKAIQSDYVVLSVNGSDLRLNLKR